MTSSYCNKLEMNKKTIDNGYVHVRGFIISAFVVIFGLMFAAVHIALQGVPGYTPILPLVLGMITLVALIVGTRPSKKAIHLHNKGVLMGYTSMIDTK